MTSVMIATPAYGNMVTLPYMHSIMALQNEAKDIDFDLKTYGNESLITRARNFLTAMFLDNKYYTHMLFVDADIAFNSNLVFRMLSFDKDVVCGAYPQKTILWDKVRMNAITNPDQIQACSLKYNINVLNPDSIESIEGFIRVFDAGTALMLIKRQVFEKMIVDYPELEYEGDYQSFPTNSAKVRYFAFFDCMIDSESKRYLSEDFTFCRRWQKLGGEIWCDITSPISHMGNYIFEGDISAIVSNKVR